MELQKLEPEQIDGIIKTLKQMDDEKYNKIQNWKYINFLPNGEYAGYSNYVVMMELIYFFSGSLI